MGRLLDDALHTTKAFLSFNSLNAVTKNNEVYKLWTCMGCHETLFITLFELGTKEERKCHCGSISRISFWKNGSVKRKLVKKKGTEKDA